VIGLETRGGIIGRERELADIERLRVEPQLGVALLVGEAGIGKTAVWEAALAQAAEAGSEVLSIRPVEAEAKLAFAALADLLGPVVDAGLADLPEPQRQAIEVTLLRAAPEARPLDRRAVATGVCSLIRARASEIPVVIAVDDYPWLDRESAFVLSFALRRLRQSPVLVLLTARLQPGSAPSNFDFDRILGDHFDRISLGALSLSSIQRLIRERLGQVLVGRELRRVAQASGGNPLFAIELARAMVERGFEPSPGEPLVVSRDVGDLLGNRIRQLPVGTRHALLLAGSLSRPDLEVMSRLIGAGGVLALEVAEQQGIVMIERGRIRFTHPLLASSVYSSASPEELRAVHAQLAKAVRDTEEQARHLALAVEGTDETVAHRLELAASQADRRAAPHAAVELADLACRLTPGERVEAHERRAFDLVQYIYHAGDAGDARRRTEEFIAELSPGPRRARAFLFLARILHDIGTSTESITCGRRALADAGDDVELQALIHWKIASQSWDDFDLARQHCRIALEIIDRLDDPDPALVCGLLTTQIGLDVFSGLPLPEAIVERALALEKTARGMDAGDRPSTAMGAWLKQAGDFDGAHEWFEATHRAALEEGKYELIPYVLGHLPLLELWTGHWDLAERHALEHLDHAEVTAQPSQRRHALYDLAFVHAHMGRVDEARSEASELLREAEDVGDRWEETKAYGVLGFLDLSLGSDAAAAVHLRRCIELVDTIGSNDPRRSYGDYAEALIALGDLDRAEVMIGVLDTRARRADDVRLRAVAATARAQLESSRGDLDAAATALDEALAQHARTEVPFEFARTLLTAGQVRRRRGERRLAKEALLEAQAIFHRLGAPLWADRASAELRRVPIRRGSGAELTPSELRVAELAAAGRTNREIAQVMFISPKTVESNLSRAYRKLGIHSRAELGATMATRERQSVGNPPML